MKSERDNPNRYRVYDPKGVSPCLSGTSGGGRQPYISFMDLTIGGGITLTDNARTLNARYGKGPAGRKAENSGVFIGIKKSPQSKNNDENNDIPVIWNKEHQCYIAIRKLTPKECFRLQGVPDEYFDRAAFVNSDNQLFKQAGNSVTVPVIKAIGEKIKSGSEI